MTIIDAENRFSYFQGFSGGSSQSHDVIDLGAARNIAAGEPIRLEIQVTEAFTALTSLQVDVIQSDAENMSSPDVLASATLAVADLVVGARFAIEFTPRNDKQFLALDYTVVGTNPGAGAVHAHLTHDSVEDSRAYPGVV